MVKSYNSYGKPYILNSPLHFNISHSGEWVVCALSYNKVGIDIEYVKEIDYDIAKNFFCRSEYESLMEKSDVERLNYFYDIWTLKESYIKWMGSGLSTPLDSFCFRIIDEDIVLQDKLGKEVPYFSQYYVDGYKLSVCASSPCFVDRLNEINVENIFIK